MHVMGLCLPVDFQPVLLLGQLLGSWAWGRRQQLPGMGAAAGGRGTPSSVLLPRQGRWLRPEKVDRWLLCASAESLHQHGKILSVGLWSQ